MKKFLRLLFNAPTPQPRYADWNLEELEAKVFVLKKQLEMLEIIIMSKKRTDGL